jgi:hypothetical protein
MKLKPRTKTGAPLAAQLILYLRNKHVIKWAVTGWRDYCLAFGANTDFQNLPWGWGDKEIPLFFKSFQ